MIKNTQGMIKVIYDEAIHDKMNHGHELGHIYEYKSPHHENRIQINKYSKNLF